MNFCGHSSGLRFAVCGLRFADTLPPYPVTYGICSEADRLRSTVERLSNNSTQLVRDWLIQTNYASFLIWVLANEVGVC